MLVKHWMSTPPISVKAEASILYIIDHERKTREIYEEDLP